MNEKPFKRVLSAFIVVLVVAALGYAGYTLWQNNATDNKKEMEYIKATVRQNGKIVEGMYAIGVKSKDDIKWYYKNDNVICVQYGNVLLKYELDDLKKKDVLDDLGYIGITITKNKKTGKLTFYYWGEKITQYAEG